MIVDIKYDEKGLVPAIIQDVKTNEVLMLAYMNKESLAKTIASGQTWFYSRSRKELWNKGATSGNVQNVVDVFYDCDQDALLIKVEQNGVACHTGEYSCFYRKLNDVSPNKTLVSDNNGIATLLNELYSVINDRKENPKEGSYTTYLFEKGLDKILKKIGEECTEVIIGAKNNDDTELIYELADLTYHSLVLMIEKGIKLSDIAAELSKRHIVDKKIKQEKIK